MSADPHHGQKPIELHSPAAHSEDGEGNWLVSYADMMTLLVGFFVILLSFSTVDQGKYEEAKKSITQQFGGIYQKPFNEIVQHIKEALDKAGVGDQFSIKATESGVEISFLGTVFFATGSADLKPEARELLASIMPTIKREATDFDIFVEGHTDDVPLMPGGEFRNNWELSSIRACRVLDSFSKYGFAKEHLTAIGYGETRPVVPNRSEDGTALPENQGQNRRVVVRLVKRQSQTL